MNRRYLHIATILVLTTVIFLAFGCQRHSEAWKLMDTADSLMESVPDSSLSILRTIDSVSLSGKEERARLALLTSMALDKNYIDTTDFSVLQPAIDYYLRKGNADEKLRTYYYQGRICQNKGDDDTAMKCFVRGINLRDEVSDTLTLARMLVAQSYIFKFVYDLDRYTNNLLEAASLFKTKGRYKERSICLIEALEGSVLNKNKALADSIYSVCVQNASDGNLSKSVFLPYELSYLDEYGSREALSSALSQASEIDIPTSDCILTMANCHLELGENDTAIDLLKTLEVSGMPYDTLRLDGTLYLLYVAKEDYRNALARYECFNNRYYGKLEKMLDMRLQSSEERHLAEITQQKEQSLKRRFLLVAIAGVSLFLAILVILLLVLRMHRILKERSKERERATRIELDLLRKNVSELLDERDSLQKIIESSQEIPENIWNVARKRIEMLNLLLVNEITDNSRHIEKSRELIESMLSQKLIFMNETRLAFSASHPNFIRYLIEHGLSEEEINYVCLYAIGLNGKEVGSYLEKGGHINMSSAIRKKLGIGPHDTNLSIYIRKLLANSESPSSNDNNLDVSNSDTERKA